MSLSFLFGTVGSPIATPPRPGGTVGGVQYSASIGLDALELAWVNGVRIGEGRPVRRSARPLKRLEWPCPFTPPITPI